MRSDLAGWIGVLMADFDDDSGGGGGNAESSAGSLMAMREQDRLTIAKVSRIMKKALAANAKISKEAKETVQKCVSEFIKFIAGEDSDKCRKEKWNTINSDDLRPLVERWTIVGEACRYP